MNKLILGTILAVGLCCAEVDYNKVMNILGGNCKFKTETIKENKKNFTCDNGFIHFNFDDYEIIIVADTLVDNKKYKIAFLFNRAWDRNGNQIHKRKSTIAIVEDEFGTVVNSASGKWSGNEGDFYKRFKEDVYYRKQETVEYKKNYETTETRPVKRMEPNSLGENCWGDPNGSWFCE